MTWTDGGSQRIFGATDGEAPAWAMLQPQHERSGNERPLISIVDDDESVRESLPDLVRELGFAAVAFSSAEEFLASDGAFGTKCLILDVVMPGMTGPELQQELKRRGRNIPIVFVTAQTNDNLRAKMLEQGAVDCLIKPFSDVALLDAVNLALHGD